MNKGEIVEVEPLQTGQPLKMHQSRVGDLGVGDEELLQTGQSLKMRQPCVGDLGVAEEEPLQTGQSRQMHQPANRSDMAEGIRRRERARNARPRFDRQEARETRRLLDVLVSNGLGRDGQLTADFRQPCDVLADTAMASRPGRIW